MQKFKHLQPRQMRRLLFWIFLAVGISAVFLGLTSYTLIRDKQEFRKNWTAHLTESDTLTEEEQTLTENAVKVETGTYVETIDSVDIRNSKFELTFQMWFSWEDAKNQLSDMDGHFQIYKGQITGSEKLQDYKKGKFHYQLFRIRAMVSHEFNTIRFPLGTYQLRFYVMPNEDITRLLFLPQDGTSGVNDNMNLTGFDLTKADTAMYYRHTEEEKRRIQTYRYADTEDAIYSEFLTMVELDRNSWGLYFKCVIALLGATAWALLALFVNAFYKADTMNMFPPVLFGMASNIMVGANLVPDTLETGLLEYINIWGIFTFILTAMVISVSNHIRKEQGEEDFAVVYGKTMFVVVLAVMAAGHLILPLAAYHFH